MYNISSGQTCEGHRNKSRALTVMGGSEDRSLWGSDIWTDELAQHPNSHPNTQEEKKILGIISVGLTQWKGFPRATKLTRSNLPTVAPLCGGDPVTVKTDIIDHFIIASTQTPYHGAQSPTWPGLTFCIKKQRRKSLSLCAKSPEHRGFPHQLKPLYFIPYFCLFFW